VSGSKIDSPRRARRAQRTGKRGKNSSSPPLLLLCVLRALPGESSCGRTRVADDVKIDPKWAWEKYKPSDKAPWDVKRVGHLYRRTTFGANLEQLKAGVAAGPEKAVAAVLDGGPGLDVFDKRMQPLAETIARTNNANNLTAWWLTRTLYSPHPF